MMSSRLSLAIDFIKARQNPDGGWGYGAGRMSLAEPTAFCLLAIQSSGKTAETARGLDFLRSCQKPSGAVGIDPKTSEGSWMAYAALLVFHALGAGGEEGRLKSWMLGFEDASARFTAADIESISEAYRFDASIMGWPWTPNTTGWVEPTALFILALIRTGVPAKEKRIRSGVDLLLDRALPSGGWNFGNPYAKLRELEANLLSTALALAALGAAGIPEGRPAVGAGLRRLIRFLAGDVSTASFAWALLALKSFPSGSAQAPAIAARLSSRQEDDGGFHANHFETALSFLVLSDARVLRPDPGRSG
jgi:hypothetical protein